MSHHLSTLIPWVEGAHRGLGHQPAHPAPPHVRWAAQTHPKALWQAAGLRQLQGARRPPQGPPRPGRPAGGAQQLRGAQRPASGRAPQVLRCSRGAVYWLCEGFRSSSEGLHEDDTGRAEATSTGCDCGMLTKYFALQLHLSLLLTQNFSLCLQFSNKIGTEGNLISQFQEEYSRVLQLLQGFSFCPENLPPATSTKKPFEKKTLEKQTSKKQLAGPVSWTSHLRHEEFLPLYHDLTMSLVLVLFSKTASCRQTSTVQDFWYAMVLRNFSRQRETSMQPRIWTSQYKRET